MAYEGKDSELHEKYNQGVSFGNLGKQATAIGTAAAIGIGSLLGTGCATRTNLYSDIPREVSRTTEIIPPDAPIEQRIDDLFTKNWSSMAGGFSRYDGHRDGAYNFTLVSPEADPSGRDQRFGWRYGQFDDFMNAVGIGDKVTEDKAVADIMIQYMRDHGVEGRISDSVRSITISREGDLNSNSLIKSAERGEYEGFIIVRNGSNPSVIEDVLYASRDVGSSRFRGYVAQRNPDDQHSSNWGHVYWKNGDTVRIEDGYAGIMNFPTLEADREREVVTRERTTTNESWCDQNPNDCDALKILGVGIGLGLLGWGVYELTRPPEDNHHDRPPTPQPNPSGGGQDGGPGTGDQ